MKQLAEPAIRSKGSAYLCPTARARSRESTTTRKVTHSPSTKSVGEADTGTYDGLVLPGGTQNPDRQHTDKHTVEFVHAFFDADKPVAVICHSPLTLVEADVVRGRRSWGKREPYAMASAFSRVSADYLVVSEILPMERRAMKA
jgi:putative intracellular protease/amidase